MPKNNRYIDYEYNDEEFYARQKRRSSQNSSQKRPPSANTPNPKMKYNDLAAQNRNRKSDDVKLYVPKGQPSQQYRSYQDNAYGINRQPGREYQGVNRQPSREYQGDRRQINRAYQVDSQRRMQAETANGDVKRKKKKKKGAFRRFIRSVFLIVLALYIAASAYIYSIVSNVTENDDSTSSDYVSSGSLADDMFVENILFIGVDSRGEEKSRSDTMMLVSIDKKNHKLKLTSFLRDTYVTIPGYGEAKLNAACFYGGPQLVVDTIEYNFGIDIDHYFLVDFEAFIDIIDALGGTDVEVTEAEAQYMRTDVKIPWVKAGMNHFNGFVTLWYCRIRYLDNDFNRTERQRKVISAILSSAKKQNPFELVKTVKKALPYIQTDMSPLEMTLLSEGMGLFYMHFDIVQQQIPYKDEYEDRLINEQLVLYIDVAQTSQKLKQFIYE